MGGANSETDHDERSVFVWGQDRLPEKRSRKLPGGGLGVSPQPIKVPQDWGIEGVDKEVGLLLDII